MKRELDLKLLRKISDYYEFPFAVFFTPKEVFKGTRRKYWSKKIKKLINVLEEFLEEIK